MNWFKHDTDAAGDAKLKRLILRFGAEGYAVYFHCIELIVADINETNVTFELEHDAEIIADNLKIKGDSNTSGIDRVQAIMKYIVTLGLFEEQRGRISCYKILKRLDGSMVANGKLRKTIESAKVYHGLAMTNPGDAMAPPSDRHDTAMTNPGDAMLDKIRREEIRKEENSRYTYLGEKSDSKPKRAIIQRFPIQEVLDYLNKVARKNFTLTDAYRKFIEARFKEGASFEDFVRVIDSKTEQWYSDEEMAKYLRPQTLFNATKFQSYLNEAPAVSQEQSTEDRAARLRRLAGETNQGGQS